MILLAGNKLGMSIVQKQRDILEVVEVGIRILFSHLKTFHSFLILHNPSE